MAQTIIDKNLPLPPNSFVEMVADRTWEKAQSKQDFRMTMDGDPGEGKSTSSLYIAARYAIEMADRNNTDPYDYFTLENCALLEDTERITHLLKETGKHQAVIIDDAGVALDSRDFQTRASKNMSKIYQTCRTKRWFTIFNIPRVTHVDLRIRELVNAKASIYKSFHAGGFNILKIFSSRITSRGYKKTERNPRLIFDKKKISFFVEYSTDILAPLYVGLQKEYDIARDEAGTRILDQIAEEEKLAKTPGPSKREKKEKEMEDKHCKKVKELYEKDPKIAAHEVLRKCPGLTLTYLNKIRAKEGL
jgi:hypothetical protein